MSFLRKGIFYKTCYDVVNVLLNACKDFDLVENIGKTKYTEIGHHMVNEHLTVCSKFMKK
jgi:hypothetical protein